MNQYSAYTIDTKVRPWLLSIIRPTRENVVAHHVTYYFGKNTLPPKAKLEIVGVADADGAQALIVRVDGSIHRPDGKIFHCTWSLDDGVSASHSNDVIANAGWFSYPDPVEFTAIPTVLLRSP